MYAARQSAGELEVLDYRGALPETGASTVKRTVAAPAEAAATLRERSERPTRRAIAAAAHWRAAAAAAAAVIAPDRARGRSSAARTYNGPPDGSPRADTR